MDIKIKPTHVMIRCGYTSRILTSDLKNVSRACSDEKTMEEFLKNCKCLFLMDALWGDGEVIITDSDATNTVRELIERKYPMTDGYIVFAIESLYEAFGLVSSLIEMEFCGCFSHENLYEMEYVCSEDGKIRLLKLSYDTESG